MKFYTTKASFASGELAPVLAARSDLAAYMIGAKEMTNCLVLPQGGLINRPGTTKLGQGDDIDGARLVPFVSNEEASFCLVFKIDNTVDVYDTDGLVVTITDSPYSGEHLKDLRWLQSVDVLYLFHQRVPVYKLMHYSDSDWEFIQVYFKNGPYQDMNTDDGLNMRLTGDILESDWDCFTPDMIGSRVKLELKIRATSGEFTVQPSGTPPASGSFTISNTAALGNMTYGPTFRPFGNVTVENTSSGWTGNVEIQTWTAYGWEMIQAYQSDGTLNFSYEFTELNSNAMYRVGYSATAGTSSVSISWSSSGGAGTLYEVMLFGASIIETRGLWSGTVYIYRKTPDEPDYPLEPFRTWVGDGTNNFGLSVSEQDYGVMFKITATKTVRVVWASGGGIIARNLLIAGYNDARSVNVTSKDLITGNVDWTSEWAMGAFGEDVGYPALGVFHQERLVLANTPFNPQTIWFSQSASWENFGTTIPAVDTDSIMVTLAARQLNAIRGFSSRSELLVLTSGAEWVLKAGAKSDVITPSSIVVTPSTYRGSANIETLDVGQSTLFVQKHGKVVRGMGYQLDIDGYSSAEISILSNHLMEGTRIIRWAYQQEPWSVVWIALENGVVLALTLQSEHQVTAWTRQVFNGDVKDICCVSGDDQDEVFMIIGDRVVRLNHRDDLTGSYSEDDYKDDGADIYQTVFESLELEQGADNGTLQGRQKQVPGATMRLYRTVHAKAGIMTENSSRLDIVHHSDEPYTGDIYVRLPGGMAKTCRIRVENAYPGPMAVLGIFQEVAVSDG
jgi:hypothetical protein